MQYRVNVRRFSWREFRRGSSLLKALLYWCVTRFVQLPCSTEQPPVDSLKTHIVAPDKLPAGLIAKFQDATQQLVALGFRGRVFHLVEDPINQSTHCHADFVASSGETIARVKHRVFRATTPHKPFDGVEFASQAADGTFVVTSNSADDFDTPPNIQEEHHKKMPPAELWALHQARLKAEPKRYRTVRDARGVVDFVEDVHRANHEYLVERGIFVEVPIEAEVAQSPQPVAPLVPAIAAADGDVMQLLHEVRRQERKKTSSLTSAVLLLLITGALFVAFGGLAWSWKFTLLLVPILLFHELGHFLCMKMFDYRNVRMFFIPLFGAAVSGRNYNVPGWKRIITSLMGPLPGIFLGIGLGVVGLVRGYDSLVLASLVMIGLNAFNLVPALPLDGGWIAHGLVFSRHAFLDLLFRIGAIGLLLLVGVAGGTWLTFGLGIAMLMGLPAAFHSARITDRLRAEGEPFGKSHSDTVPEVAIARISDELDQAYPKGMALKQKAVLALQIYQNVCSPPPGVLGTLILGSVYLVTILAAVVGGSVLFVAHRGDVGQLLAEGLDRQQPVVMSEILRQPATATAAVMDSAETMVTNFPDHQQATEQYHTLASEIGPERRLLLYGSTLMLPLTADDTQTQRDAWFDRLDQAAPATEMFGESVGSTFIADAGNMAHVQLSCTAADEAQAQRIAAELSAYLQSALYTRLIPPWQKDQLLTDEQRKARLTAAALLEYAPPIDEEWYAEWNTKMDEATRRGRREEVRKLQAEMDRRRLEYEEAKMARLRQASGEYDQEVIDLYAKWLETNDETQPNLEKHWIKLAAPKLGQIDNHAGSAFAATGGADHDSTKLHLYLQFESLPSGLLAVTEWLDAGQCREFRYQVFAGSGGEE